MCRGHVGEFGIVYKGMMKKGGVHHVIAVKALKGKENMKALTKAIILLSRSILTASGLEFLSVM